MEHPTGEPLPSTSRCGWRCWCRSKAEPAAWPDRWSTNHGSRTSTNGVAGADIGSFPRRLYGPVYRRWFRVEWQGLEKIPDQGGALLVANHAGAIPADAPAIMHGIEKELRTAGIRVGRLFVPLDPRGRDAVVTLAGGVPAHPDNAYRLLHDQEQLALVFPEGTKADREAVQGSLSAPTIRPGRVRRDRHAGRCPGRAHRRHRRRGASHESSSASAATGPTTVIDGARTSPCVHPGRSSRAFRGRCAGRAACRVPRPPRARPRRARRRSARRRSAAAGGRPCRGRASRETPPARGQSSAVSSFSGSSWPVTSATALARPRWVTGIPA